ncbi:MAG: ABC transporter permease [Burkholderiales bacterium]|nr:ABC transporter permease [Burkholderiales bacterium]
MRNARTTAMAAGLPLVGLTLVLLAWEAAARLAANATLVPPPLVVGRAFIGMLDGDLPADIGASLVHLSIGYSLGVISGLILALIAAGSRRLEAVIDPLVEFLRPISPIAWIPLAILFFGVGRAVPVYLIFYAALFPIFVSTLDGIRRVDPRLVLAAASLGASRALVVRAVVLPAALPSVIAGARLSLGVAWMSLVAGEIVGGDAGIGWRILWYQEFFQMDHVLAAILVVGVLGLAADLVLRGVQALARRWNPAAAEGAT